MEEGSKRIIVVHLIGRGKLQAEVNNVIHACTILVYCTYILCCSTIEKVVSAVGGAAGN